MGHRRGSIYAANLIVCIAAGAIQIDKAAQELIRLRDEIANEKKRYTAENAHCAVCAYKRGIPTTGRRICCADNGIEGLAFIINQPHLSFADGRGCFFNRDLDFHHSTKCKKRIASSQSVHSNSIVREPVCFAPG